MQKSRQVYRRLKIKEIEKHDNKLLLSINTLLILFRHIIGLIIME